MSTRAWDHGVRAAAIGFLFACTPYGYPYNDGYDRCRFEPDECPGGIGGFCDDDDECQTDFCCDLRECDGGMCTFRCDEHDDCPGDMRCEHGVCFLECDDNDDCANGMTCAHGHKVCEWP